MKKTALILGSTGLTGSHLLEILLSGNAYGRVVSFVRKATGKSHPKLTEHIVDFDDPDTYRDLVLGDDLFCCLGTTIKKAGTQEAFARVDMEYPLNFADAAQKNGVEQYLIVSSIGANPESGNFYLRTKGRVEARLREKHFETTIVAEPSFLLGNRKEFRLGEKIGLYVMKVFSVFMIGRLRRYRAVESRQVAQSLYDAAQAGLKGYYILKSEQLKPGLNYSELKEN